MSGALIPRALADSAPDTSAASAVLMDASTGEILYERDGDRQMLIASTTKIMTALVVLENCDISETVEIKREYTAVEGSSIYLKPGETVTVETLLYGMMLSSGNDASMALACHVAGNVTAFSAMMNDKAAEMGLADTAFENPHGLDGERQYSTARDMALLTARAMEDEAFAKIVSTKSISIEGRSFTNHNKLLWRCQGALGVKTGYTKRAGRTLVSCCERNGMRLVCVTLDDGNDWADHSNLYDWAFSAYKRVGIAKKDAVYCKVPVISGLAPSVSLTPEDDCTLLIKGGDAVEIELQIPKFVYADARKGERAGEMKITVNGKEAARITLVYKETVLQDRKQMLTFWEKVARGWNMSLKYGYTPYPIYHKAGE